MQAFQNQSEFAGDETSSEIASLQEELLNGKNISDLEETAAGGTQSAGGVSSNGVSLGAAGFVNGGHYSNVNANFGDLSSQTNASAEAFTNVSGGASEEGFSLDTLAAAIDNAYNNILPQTLEVSVTAVDDNVVTGNTDQAVSSNLDIEGNILEHENSQRTGLHITNDNTPTLVGKATSNATISIFDGEGENAPLLGTTTADNDGNWSYTPNDFSPTIEGKAEPFADINLVIRIADNNTSEGHIVEELKTKAKADGSWEVESQMLDSENSIKYTVQESSVDEAGNKYAEPQASTFYLQTEPIYLAPTDHL